MCSQNKQIKVDDVLRLAVWLENWLYNPLDGEAQVKGLDTCKQNWNIREGSWPLMGDKGIRIQKIKLQSNKICQSNPIQRQKTDRLK